MHDLTVLIEETGAYPTAVLCRIERFLADFQFAAARSMCRMYRSGKTILVTAIQDIRSPKFVISLCAELAYILITSAVYTVYRKRNQVSK